MAHTNSESKVVFIGDAADSTQHGAHAESAIDAVLGKTEQTYEEFMNCFIGLKKEDVVPYHVRRMADMLAKNEDDEDRCEGQSAEVDRDEVKDGSDAHNVKSVSGQEGIDTEELDEGMLVPTRQTDDLPLGNRFVKMDNFVEDEELLDEGLLEESHKFEDFASFHYESSIGSTGSPRLRPPEGPAARISMVEKKKEAGLGIRVDAKTETPPEADEIECSDPCLEIADNSVVNPLKISQDLLRRSREDDEGGEGEEEVSRSSSELRRSFEMKTLPGEAEEESGTTSSLPSDHDVHHTELKMSSRRVEEDGGQCPETEAPTEASTSDEIQPFSLDADFDYDNVTLTPKWDLNQQPFRGNSDRH